MVSTEEKNSYELLGVNPESTEGEIKTAYRKLSLKVHPDRNPNNPDAAAKFHELNQAYELLLDPLRRLALDASVRAKEARKARFAKFDAKRKNLQEELEERERAFKKQKLDKAKEAKAREQENERIKEEGRKLREEKERELKKREEELLAAKQEEDEVPQLGNLDTTVKLKYLLSTHPTLTTASSLSTLLSQFGPIDTSSIVLSLKPPKKAPHKPPKHGTALVPFTQIGAAFAAVCASGRKDRGLEEIEVSWAGGSEPEIMDWLRRKGKLDVEAKMGSTEGSKSASPEPKLSEGRPSATPTFMASTFVGPATATASFSSFPDFDSTPDQNSSVPLASSGPPGLDYESLTLMRMRQAERARLEKEIREQEENE